MNLKLKLNKKGEEQFFAPSKMLFWILFGLVLGLFAVFFIIFVARFSSEKAIIPENLESYNLMQRFYESPDCFVYDKDGVLVVNTIDTKKFNNAQLSDCFSIEGHSGPAFRISLFTDKEIELPEPVYTSNWNVNRPAEEKTKLMKVAIIKDDKKINGEILVEIQNVQ